MDLLLLSLCVPCNKPTASGQALIISHSCNRCQETQLISKTVHGGVSDTFFFFWAGFTISNVLLHIRTTENSKFHLASFFCHCGLRKIAIVLCTLSFLKSSDIIYKGNRTTTFFLWNRKKNNRWTYFLKPQRVSLGN